MDRRPGLPWRDRRSAPQCTSVSASTSARGAPGRKPPTRRAREQQNPGAPPLPRRLPQRTILTSLALATITVVAFAAVRNFGFVDYDDLDYVAANPHVAPGLTWTGVRWAFTSAYAANWHPIAWLSHMLDVQLFGMNAGAHHMVSLAYHVVNTLLLFDVLRRMTGSDGKSAFVAALFALHPMHVESVAWIAERKDVLSAFFFLLALRTYAEYAPRLDRRWYTAVFVCLALGLMSKPMLVTAPFVLLLLDYWPLRRTINARVLAEKLPMLGLAAASSVVTIIVQRHGGAVMRLQLMPLHVRLAAAAVSYGQYVSKLVWPAGLAAMYPARRAMPEPGVLAGSIMLLVAVTTVAIRLRRSRPYLLVGWLWFVGMLIPVIGIVQVGAQSMADRYAYLPSIGLFAMAAWGVPDLVVRWRRATPALLASGGIIVVACTIVTVRQVTYWRSSRALWQHAADVVPDNYFAQASLGYVLWKEGRDDEAIARLEESLRLRPDFAEAHNNLGVVLARRGDLHGAASQFSQALDIEPSYKAAQDNLAATTARLNSTDAELATLVEGARANPNDLVAHNELGVALAARGRVDEAIAEFQNAIRVDPNQPDVHFNLGAMLEQRGRTADAAEQFRITLRLNPAHAAARAALDALSRRGKSP